MAALHHDPSWPRAGDWPAPRPGERADIALVGVPAHETSLSPTSAHLTPAAVREALRRYSLEPTVQVVDAGDVPPAPQEARAALAAIDADLVIALGGDNSVTVPVALGRFGDRLATAGLVTLDAHHDIRDGVSNGSPVRELVAAGLPGTRVAQVGIEPFANSATYAQRAADLGFTVITRQQLRSEPIESAMARALAVASAGGGPVHVDLDVDVCDRSVAPGCPASVPGGITAIELRAAARAAGRHPAVVSIDLVEVDVTADTADQRTVRLVALCVLEAIAGYQERIR